MFNYDNLLVDQGSSWVFRFTPSTAYPAATTLRFVFPEGFSSSKVQCDIAGITDPNMRTRGFPNKHVFDCLNINAAMSGPQEVILSGVINPGYRLSVDSIELHILQPNNRISL